MHILVPPHISAAAARGDGEGRAHGAVLVVDAEGSTALSARLERHGTAGAEALADILAAVFSPMVEQVTALGGVVAEFAGDGIVAVFFGDHGDAVGRAIEAARSIARELAETSDIATPDGPVHLVVRSAIGAGEIEWRVWTTDRTDVQQAAAYTYVGTALAEAQRGEASTPGGAISVGPIARTSVPAERLGRDLGGGIAEVLLDGPASKREPPAAPTENPISATSAFFPSELATRADRGEFRDVVTVFAEFRRIPDTSGTSVMSTLLDLLATHRGYLCNVVRAHPDSDGIRALAFWGAPTSREHDIGYALRFLEDLRSATDRTWLRAAATRSAVFAGFVGGRSQESYTGIGHGVNLAARMCADTPWGEIRIDEHIAARLEAPWAHDDLGPIDYRGFDRPIRTHAVTNVPPVRAPDPLEGALVGRNAELDRLEDLLAPLWSGRPAGTIAVTGDAGIGKSAVVEAVKERLRHRAPPPVWLEARADEIRTQPFATIRDALAAYFGRPGEADTDQRLGAYVTDLRSHAPDMSAELDRSRRTLEALLRPGADDAGTDQLDPRTRFENIVLAVENVVLALEHRTPVIISISDAHWIDDDSTTILDRVRTDLAERRIAMIVETRDPDVGLDVDHVLVVDRLRPDAVSDLAHRYLGESPDEALLAWLVDRADGNPYFVRQLLAYLTDRFGDGSPIDLQSVEDDDVPVDVRRALVARLDGLPTSVRRLVQTASVLGHDVDLAVISSMVGDVEFSDDDVDAAIGAGAWTTSDGAQVSFRNLLIREAAYGMLLGVDRRALHGEAARAIAAIHGDDDRTAAQLAFHYDRSGASEEAAGRYGVAGRIAASEYANAEALSHLDRALELLPDGASSRRAEVLRIIHDVNDVLGERSAQQRAIDGLAAVADDDADRTAVAVLRARLAAALGSYEEADGILRGLPADQLDGSSAFLSAQIARYRGATTEAVTLARDARRRFVAEENPTRAAVVDDFLGGMAYERGEFARAAELHRSAAEVFRTTGSTLDEIRALNNLGTAIFAMGDYSSARSIHEEGADRSRAIGYRMGEGDHIDNVGGTAWAVGDFDLAIERYAEALTIRSRMDDAWGIAISTGNLAATMRALGRYDEALEGYRAALEVDRSIGRRRGEAYDLHGIGLCHLDMGRLNLATEALDQAAAIRRDLDEGHLARESQVACAVAMARRGDTAEAASLVEAVLDAEGPTLFDGAVETTATLLRCIEVLEAAGSDRAGELRERTAERVRERALRISDPAQRRSYLDSVESHRRARGNG